MPCYGPLTAYHSKEVSKTGKRKLVFKRELSHSGIKIQVPCGQCIGCRLDKARSWAIRCVHEQRMCNRAGYIGSFVTLTYADEHMPDGGTLVKRDLQLFMKRLRKHFDRPGIRFYACGEYGDGTSRPHYHLLLFNVDFAQSTLTRRMLGKTGEPLYSSSVLELLWPYGNNLIGSVSFDSCAYVARYILKKSTGPDSLKYEVMTRDGELLLREPEFTVMSRRPGVGSTYYQKYGTAAYDHDFVVIEGDKITPPAFYDNRFRDFDDYGPFRPGDMSRLDKIKLKRRRKALTRKADNTKKRLRVRETVELRKIAFFKKRAFL